MLTTSPTTDPRSTDPEPTRVVLAEDHELFADALARTLQASNRFEIVDCVTSGDKLVQSWQHHQPDLVITDLSMRPVGGIEATRAIREIDPTARVVVVTAFEEHYLIRDVVDAGAVGFVSKCAPKGHLLQHLIDAAEGRPAFDATATTVLVGAARGDQPRLSPRQLEVLTLRARGLTIAEIGAELFIGTATVKTHLSGAYQALGASGSNLAIRRAIEAGLIDPFDP